MNKFKNLRIVAAILLGLQILMFGQVPTPKGLWRFDDYSKLTKADIGNDLELVGAQTAIPGPGNGAVKIGKGSFYKMNHGIVPPNNVYYVNEYTLQFDFRIPSFATWYCFFQTSSNNSNDGDCFINNNGNIGVEATGYSDYSIKSNEWYRLVVSVKNGFFHEYYLDGQQVCNGIVQSLHGRFALDKILLLFADNNGEDGEIDCAEIAIWDKALSADEIKSLGGFGHTITGVQQNQLILKPYLQAPTSNSIYVCWHDPNDSFTKVEYGTTALLGESALGNSEMIFPPYRWHSVKLEKLLPNKEYFYRVVSGSGTSQVYSFKTQPDNDYKGKLRFLLLSDTHSDDTTMVGKIIQQAKEKLQELYGSDYQNKVNMVLHSGDLVMSGNDITQWTKQYFAPMSKISGNIPFMTVAGNHEGENRNYYSYMKYDDHSDLPDDLKERFWTLTLGNTAIIGLNSNLLNLSAVKQLTWLDQKLSEIEANPKIDFVFLLVHHLPISELWGEGITDNGSKYVNNQIIPILKKYSKVVQLSYGHTHGFERGTIESDEVNSRGDFRIVCGGGGGGEVDRWGSFRNQDFSNIHISLDQYCYQIIEIDVANKTFESSLYSLGNYSKSRNYELMDRWYKKIDQAAPEKPVAYNPSINFSRVVLNTSAISSDSLMSVRVQIADGADYNNCIVNTIVNWKNVYGVDGNYNPVDLNKNINLTNLSFNRSLFVTDKNYFYRVQYRDHNLKWSEWSNTIQFKATTSSDDDALADGVALKQNFPNPYNSTTKIIYKIQKRSFITLKVYDILGNEISVLVNEEKDAGEYEAKFDGRNLSSGVYFYKLQAGDYSKTKKLTLVR